MVLQQRGKSKSKDISLPDFKPYYRSTQLKQCAIGRKTETDNGTELKAQR